MPELVAEPEEQNQEERQMGSMSLLQHLEELRRRIIQPRRRRHETWDDWDDGLDAQGNWSEER